MRFHFRIGAKIDHLLRFVWQNNLQNGFNTTVEGEAFRVCGPCRKPGTRYEALAISSTSDPIHRLCR
jgi:hypothetical protein